MTHEETSLRTKKALCDSLKNLMKHKPFSKITISELIRDCNINRKTFYYHFEDIYALLQWILEQEAVEVVKQFDLLTDFEDAFEFTIDYVEQNSFFLNCIYDSVGRDEMKRFLYRDFIGIIETFIRDTEKSLNAYVSDEFHFFLCNFYAEGLAGMLIALFQNPDSFSRENLAEYFSTVIHSSIPSAILQAAKKE